MTDAPGIVHGMTPEPHLDLMQILRALRRAYPRTELPPDTLVTYARFLEHVNPAELQAAVTVHVAKSNYFPTVAELLHAVVERQCGHMNAIEGWEEANRYTTTPVQHVTCLECDDGYVGDQICSACHGSAERIVPRTVDQLVKRALDAVGGEQTLRAAIGSELATIRAHFFKVYEQLRSDSIERRKMHLLGIPAHESRQPLADVSAEDALTPLAVSVERELGQISRGRDTTPQPEGD
jgi:hypothetical protein